jgi:DNA-binding transcriptional regulator YiaG
MSPAGKGPGNPDKGRTMTQSRARRLPRTAVLETRSDRCAECNAALKWKTSTSTSPHAWPDYGFPLKVAGLATATCRSCRTAHAVIPDEQAFHHAILEQMLRRPGALDGVEILFARKALDLTGGNFAALVGVSREHVSHIEQGHAPCLGTSADRLGRLIIASRIDPSLRLLKKLLAELDEEIGTRSRRRLVKGSGYRVSMKALKR